MALILLRELGKKGGVLQGTDVQPELAHQSFYTSIAMGPSPQGLKGPGY